MYAGQILGKAVASLVLASLSVTAWAAGGRVGTNDLAALKSLSLEDLAAVRVDTVVGASKHEQKVTEAPSAVSIVTKDDIKKQGYRTLGDGGLSGRQLGECLLVGDPALKVIYFSGYSAGMAGQDVAVLQDKNFLPKPYCPAKLLEALRRSLDGATN